MNKYETIILLKNDLSNEQMKEILDKVQNYIINNGNITKIEDLGLKKLAYEIRKNKEAYYYLIQFESNPENIYELERLYRITDEILKFIVVRLDD
jgi:small subunit ribosomal protein S6